MSRENASSANILGQTWSLIICVVVQIWAFQVMASFQANVQCFFAKCHHQKHIFVWQRVHCKLYCLGLANRIKKDVDSLPSPHGLSNQTMIDSATGVLQSTKVQMQCIGVLHQFTGIVDLEQRSGQSRQFENAKEPQVT